jgi:hypothetical protein
MLTDTTNFDRNNKRKLIITRKLLKLTISADNLLNKEHIRSVRELIHAKSFPDKVVVGDDDSFSTAQGESVDWTILLG